MSSLYFAFFKSSFTRGDKMPILKAAENEFKSMVLRTEFRANNIVPLSIEISVIYESILKT